jgi:ParB-like chromosome segregation protein Spo0J
VELKVDQIEIGKRYRKDLGDLGELAASIKAVGLLHPIVVTPAHVLVSGERRLQACIQLGWTKAPVHVVKNLEDARARLKAEHDENECRKPFTPSERVAIGEALRPLAIADALKRKESTQAKPGEGKVGRSGARKLNAPTGRADVEVASAVGMSQNTYRKARDVVEAAEQEPDNPVVQQAKEEMDRTGKVDPAFRKVREQTKDSKPKLGPPCDGMQFARMAIMDLEQIRDDDAERDQAFGRVRGWLNGKQTTTTTRAGADKGIRLSFDAIDVLKKIPRDDLQRADGLKQIMAWIEDNR